MLTNEDKMLRAILSEPSLIEVGNYDPDDYATVTDALRSDCHHVRVIAEMIRRSRREESSTQIYNVVFNDLFDNV